MIADFLIAAANRLRGNTGAGRLPPPATVPFVDVERYLGRWFEIARLPNPEQDGGGRRSVDVTATYTRRPDGVIDVRNQARDAGRSGQLRGVSATARPIDATNAKLRLTFFRLFSGRYWVLALDPDYRWALVGTPSRRRMWLLARTPALPEADIAAALEVAGREGYDVERVRRTEHGAAG